MSVIPDKTAYRRLDIVVVVGFPFIPKYYSILIIHASRTLVVPFKTSTLLRNLYGLKHYPKSIHSVNRFF